MSESIEENEKIVEEIQIKIFPNLNTISKAQQTQAE